MNENSKKKNIYKRNWKEIDAKYKRINLRFNEKEQIILSNLFIKSNEKELGIFAKKTILFSDIDYKKREELLNKTIELNKQNIFQLKNIGNNINQIAIKMNFSKLVTLEEKENLSLELEKLKSLLTDSLKQL